MVAARLFPIGALAFAVLTLAVPSSATGRPTTYAAVSPGAAIADVTAGLCLLAVGAAVTASGRHGSVGPVTTLLGVAWLAHDWVGWDQGWPSARTAAAVIASLTPALLLHLAVGFPSGRVTSRTGRLAVVGAYLAGGTLTLSLALVRDPALDLSCWANCSDNLLLVHADVGLARHLTRVGTVNAVITCMAVLCWCGWRTRHATRVARRSWTGVPAAVAAAAFVEGGYAFLTLTDPKEDPAQTGFVVIFLLRAATLAYLAATLARFLAGSAREIARVERLGDRLGPAPSPGTFRDELARSLGDDDVQVAYWLPDPGRWSDAAGKSVDREPSTGRATTVVVRNQSPVAMVTHDAGLYAMGDLGDRIGAAARLAVDNERLQAQLLAKLTEVRASRARIVAAGDATRRRLERDLHDDIQHRLLAVAYELRLARQASDDPDLDIRLSAADAETLATLTDIREVANGIFPAILSDSGIAAALRTLAERAPTALSIGQVTDARFPAPLEAAAYAAVDAAVAAEPRRGVAQMTVTLAVDGGDLVLRLIGATDGIAFLGVEDRVAALGGHITRDSSGTEVRLPCG